MAAHLTKDEILNDSLTYTLTPWVAQKRQNPLLIERGKGVYIWDKDGKRYIDFSSQLVTVNIGHGHPGVIDAVMQQMQKISCINPAAVTEARALLGKKLAEISPGNLRKTFFTLGGAEAIENAIKLARVYTGRHKIIAHYRSYHGATYGAITASGDPRRHPVDSQQMPNVIHVENPYFYRCPWKSATPEECGYHAAENMERIIRYENPESIAAIIMEGESGSSGVIKYPNGYWQRIREIADRYGILLIDDEVMSGFGRTGKWFAVDHHGVTPDILCMAKGLTSGYIPLGGLIVSDQIASYFDDRELPLGLTYSAHPVACAAANKVLSVYEEEQLIDNAARMGTYLNTKMLELQDKHPSIGDIRIRGLLGVIELVKNRRTKEPLVPWNAAADQMEPSRAILKALLDQGLYTIVRWNWIFLAPPLCITPSQIDESIDILDKVLDLADAYYSE